MINPTTEQLAELTDRINERFSEFDLDAIPAFRPLRRGQVRIIREEIDKWREEEPTPAASEELTRERITQIHDAAFTEGWQMGRESIRREQALGSIHIDDKPLQIRYPDGGIIDSGPANPTGINFGTTPTSDGGDWQRGYNKGYYEGYGTGAFSERMSVNLANSASATPDANGSMVTRSEPAIDRRALISGETLAEIAMRAGYNVVALADKYDLVRCAECGLYGTHGENMKQIEGDFYCPEHWPDDPEADLPPPKDAQKYSNEPSPQAAVTLGPEHVVATPLRPPIGRDHAPTTPKPRTLAQSDALQNELSEIVAALQEMADDGPMPSINTYNLDKPAHLPAWQTIINRHGIPSWAKLAEMCGLEVRHKQGGMTEARRAQLNRLKDERKANGRGRPSATESEDGRHTPRGSYIPTEAELISELKRQAMGGVMPTVDFFDGARPATWATAQAHMLRLKVAWNELAALAGLKPNRKGFGEPKPEAA